MNDDDTARHALPLLRAGQAQKELWHNEALLALDLLVAASVTAVGVNEPPAAPAEGACWIIGDAPVGAWSSQAGTLAGWTSGGWRFQTPRDGMAAWSVADGVVVRWVAGGWQLGQVAARRLSVGGKPVVGPRGPAIGSPTGGSVVDPQARAAIIAILNVLRAHGLIET